MITPIDMYSIRFCGTFYGAGVGTLKGSPFLWHFPSRAIFFCRQIPPKKNQIFLGFSEGNQMCFFFFYLFIFFSSTIFPYSFGVEVSLVLNLSAALGESVCVCFVFWPLRDCSFFYVRVV